METPKEFEESHSSFKAFIDSFPFRSMYKVYPEVKARFPNVRRKDVEAYLRTKPKDVIPKDNDKYQRKTYTNYIGGWQMDLLVSSKHQRTRAWVDGMNITGNRYYLLCININTRFIYASKAIPNKRTETVLPEIKAFVDKFKPLVIFCDNEGAFTSHETVDYLIDKDVELKVITEQLHSTLGIINRACRTLRDMLGTNDIRDDKLHDVINTYNNSVHHSTGVSPKYMSKHQDAELLYIINCILRDMGVKTENEYDLEEGSLVRYVLDKKTFSKVRHKVSVGSYKIDSVEGNNYVIIAKDGTTKKVPRYRLIPVGGHENIPLAETLEEYNANRGVIDEILDYDSRRKKYKVRFTVPGGEPYEDYIPVRNMREQAPTRLSRLEREFFDRHKDKYKVQGTKIFLKIDSSNR